ncbi:MAG: NAD(P)H-hydrate dehydratase [Candidatus Limnocylindrales bacterium]
MTRRDDDEATAPRGAERLDDRLVGRLIPKRDPLAHKGTHGTLVVVAGSLDYAGAALLCAAAAVRAGAGLVCLAVPASLQPIIAGQVREAITIALPETRRGDVDVDAAVERIVQRKADALVIGPGLAAGEGTTSLVQALVTGRGVPAVVDAEALNVLAATPTWWEAAGRPCVLTPHPGEFERLDGAPVSADEQERADRAAAAAAIWDRLVVLKGARTIIAAPDGRLSESPYAVPALATAGTGDVLAGTIGALLAQGLAPYEAACLGVYLHGAAGAAISQRLGDAGLAASDLPHAIAAARRDLAAVRDRNAGERRLGFGERGG